ncbi:unnamed protein product [Urochloa decumbens]|uniref:DUF1618 domain-containing protein n=1 Tax=Urochloa decumbens TaxID=240449 RepID=A0ABC9BF18_9POAL
MTEPAPSAAAPPSMVLVDRHVGFIDELREFIKETGGLPLDRSIALALKRIPAPTHLPACSSSRRRGRRIDRGALEEMAIQDEIKRYRAEVEEPALAMLLQRKASSPSSAAAVRKEPLPEAIDGDGSLYRELLAGIEPCFSAAVAGAAPPSVTRLSLEISWPPGRHITSYPMSACIASCHRCFLVLYVGGYRPGVSVHHQPGFYLVYNASANSVAIVPPLCVNYSSHCDIGAGVAVLCCSIGDGDCVGSYVLAELLLHIDSRNFLPTNKATLFIWDSSSCWWVKRDQLVLPLPADHAADEQGTTTCSFHAHLAFAVSFSSICWVDLRTGILVYNHIHSEQFHFIPLPEECITGKLRNRRSWQGQREPDEYRTMCCLDRQTLKFVSMDESYSQECPMFTSWTLRRPLSPTNWKWEKDAVSSFCIRDLWDDQLYRDKLLRPLMPRFPVISTQEPGIIYFSITDDYKHNHSHYVLSFNMDRRRVESVYEVPSDKNAITLPPRLFTSDFSSYLNKVLPNSSVPLFPAAVVRTISTI